MLISSSSADYDILVFTETWLDDSFYDSEFLSDHYEVFRKDRADSNILQRKGGGVLIAIKKSMIYEKFMFDEIKELEAVCVKVQQKSSNSELYIYGVYIQYRKVDEELAEFYEEHLNAILQLNSRIKDKDTIIICGDFNFSNRVKWIENDCGFDYIPMCGDSTERKSEIVRQFTSMMLNNGLFQMSSLCNSAGNVLDLVYTNDPELVVVTMADFRMLPAHKSDCFHVPLTCMIELSPVTSSQDEQHQIYAFRKANYDSIREHLSGIDFPSVFESHIGDVDEMVSKFYEILNETFEEFVPKSKIRPSTRPMWHNKELASLKNKRNKDYKKLCKDRRSNANVDVLPFLKSQQRFEEYRLELHENFIREQAKNLKHNPKQFWKYINRKRKSSGFPDVMNLDNRTARTDHEKANLFADFFESVYMNHDDDIFLDSFIQHRNDIGCNDITIAHNHVKKAISGMKLNKGSGFDGVATIFLRECSDQLSSPMAILFSASLSQLYYPKAFKIGMLAPIYKSGSKKNMRNYRGVNTVPNIAKVFDIVVKEQLQLIIQPHIKSTQHGFLPCRNIETNLMEHTTHIHYAFANDCQLDTVYLDVSKAFDHVDTYLEVRKLSSFPLSNNVLFWFKSYLSDRCQYVKVGNALSRKVDVSSGVGQGSTNGPTLFTAFFDDSDPTLGDIISSNFADDKKISQMIFSSADTAQLQIGIDEFSEWCRKNKLSINKDKCKIITFTRRTKTNPIMHEYVIDNEPIVRVFEIMDLGILLDVKLTFTPHIEYIVNRATAILKFVKRQSQFFGSETIKILYSALVRSLLEFSCVIWSPHYLLHKNRLESVQKQLVLFLLGDHNRHVTEDYVLSPYTERCAQVALATLVRRRIDATILFMHSLIIGKLQSPHLRSLIKLNHTVRPTRYANFITIETCKKEYLRMSPFNKACSLFNIAARHIDPSLPRCRFRTALLGLPDDVFGDWTVI